MSSLQQQSSSELLLMSPSNNNNNDNNNDNNESNNDYDVTSDNNSGSDSESDSSEECLKEMLGGISFELDDVGGWKEEEEESEEKIPKIVPGLVDPSRIKKDNQSTTSTNKKKYYYSFGNKSNNKDSSNNDIPTATITSKTESIYQNAICSNNVLSTTTETNNKNGIQQQSTTYNKNSYIIPVEIVDMGMNNRGNGLIATQPISKGSVIYTERAYIATQINNKDVLACQYCYRSLEPITKLLSSSSFSSSSSSSSSSQSKSTNLNVLLVCPERWPILPLDFDGNNNIKHNNNDEDDDDDDHTSSVNNNNKNKNKNIIVDKYGRIQCRCCRSLFCCHKCFLNFNNEYGSCCLLNGWFQKLETMLNNNNNNNEDECQEEDNAVYDIQQASIISLASQLFFQLTQHYRRHHNKSISDDHPILNFCGISSNINDLQLGRPIKKFDNNNNSMDDDNNNNNNRNGNNNSNNNYYYSLSYVYKALCDTLRLTSTESEILSLDLFEGLACKAKRNGFEIKTQSPFKPYYSSLLHHNYGSRDTPQHQARMEQITQAILGGGQQQQPPDDESGDQSNHHHHHRRQPRRRDMDRIIEEKVAPTIASMFLLTAKLNHSCQPNAQVRCQEFVDAYIDIVASQNIDIGEEITICYIGSGSAYFGVGKKSTIQRQRELKSKYLFVCDCPLCLCN